MHLDQIYGNPGSFVGMTIVFCSKEGIELERFFFFPFIFEQKIFQQRQRIWLGIQYKGKKLGVRVAIFGSVKKSNDNKNLRKIKEKNSSIGCNRYKKYKCYWFIVACRSVPVTECYCEAASGRKFKRIYRDDHYKFMIEKWNWLQRFVVGTIFDDHESFSETVKWFNISTFIEGSEGRRIGQNKVLPA